MPAAPSLGGPPPPVSIISARPSHAGTAAPGTTAPALVKDVSAGGVAGGGGGEEATHLDETDSEVPDIDDEATRGEERRRTRSPGEAPQLVRVGTRRRRDVVGAPRTDLPGRLRRGVFVTVIFDGRVSA